ncbi:Alpha/beta hydrolase related protein [Prunus dulcis]|uniref:Alpha/beta hydrolase related protein n=1 Tax=Prunus dulcis TaxID=3755 RepID=A0A4Y1QYJ4_PRUDU|nr:Alpha/beta hydrolase related protein [Prunus dulcis]
MTRFTTTVPTTLLSALSEYLIVFLSSSSSSLNLKIDRLPLAFVARNRQRGKVSNFEDNYLN